jgi:flagellar biogenesis protein FliO
MLVAAASAQSAPTGEISRYSDQPISIAEPAGGEAPLISYSREDYAAAEAPSANQMRAAPDALPGLAADANPLRQSPQAPQFAPLATTPAVEAISLAPAEASTVMPAYPPTPISPAIDAPITQAPFTSAPLLHYDATVAPAVHEAELTATTEASEIPAKDERADNALMRRLAPPSESPLSTVDGATATKRGPLPFDFSKLESLSTAGAGLAIVVGLFLVCMWMFRRSGPKPNGPLPTDAFAVLGRAALTPQSFAHLLRVGNKLVLVAMTPSGVQPLTEVTDPMEVDRLTGLCASGRGHGPAAEFQQVLAQLSREPARGFLGAEASQGGRR